MLTLAWTCALAGLVLGGIAAVIPGFPGCAIALLGLVAFAGLTDFTIVTPGALAVATGIAIVGAGAQLTAPVVSARAAGGSAGAATGAAVGAILAVWIPVPGAAWAGAVIGAVLIGFLASRGAWIAWLRGVVGTAGGCLVAFAADGLAVLGIGAVLALADFYARLPEL
jgi:uncharacterized protein YqgC (DUF456 family)